MNRSMFQIGLGIALCATAVYAQGQNRPPAQTPQQSTADPYANNADAGKLSFPLAAPAGKDSGAKNTAPVRPILAALTPRPGSTARPSTHRRTRKSGIPSNSK